MCKEFVNADEIAKGLSPFQPDRVSLKAGRIMLSRINELFSKNESFAFETTLATRSYRTKILDAKKNGYFVNLVFFWLNSVDLAKERVKTRVLEGGHNIPVEVIERRYTNGIKNLFNIYLPIVDKAYIFDNSNGNHLLIAEKSIGIEIDIINPTLYNTLKTTYD